MDKNKVYNIVSFSVAAGFLFFGYLLYDWSFHMVPYAKHSGKEHLDFFVDLCLILWGVLLMVSTTLNYKRLSFASSFFKTIFWIGLSVIFLGAAVVVAQSLKASFLEYYLQAVGVLIIFYIPMILLYVFTIFGARHEN